MREGAARDVVKDTRVENLNAGKHQRLLARSGIKLCLWHSGEPSDQTVASFDDAEPFALFVLKQHECRQRVSPLVISQRGAQIDICNDLSIDDDEGVVFQEVSRIIHCAAGAEDRRLVNVFQPDAELAAIAQSALKDRKSVV